MKIKGIPKRTYKFSLRIFNSIAFYPVIVVTLLTFLSFLLIYLEQTVLIKKIVRQFTFLWVSGHDNAREIIAVLITGLISLTVFSFSMVMIVLNQASTTFSPRTIPGLISKKSHQIILGFYLGTIIYFLILLHSINPASSDEMLPRFGIFIGEILGLSCLILFVYFIHSISRQIQIDNIIQTIFGETSGIILKKKMEEKAQKKFEETETKWVTVCISESGYFKHFEIKNVLQFAQKHDIIIKVIQKEGTFLISGYPVIEVNKVLNNELQVELLEYFILHSDEFISENYLYGFKQLSEIAVKALSPGINDPGTALKAIDQLTILLSERININEYFYVSDKENELRIIYKSWLFGDLLYRFFTPIRTYGRKDVLIIISLLDSLKTLLFTARRNNYEASPIIDYMKIVLEDANTSVLNSADRDAVNKKVTDINKMNAGLPQLTGS